ncbi:MAG TPA: hypothetical protein VJ276_15580, partial [Thermoanaerobaculia bacterium]|nr:hypothetical protein [Thermoanaerobaculia bacterium]
MLSTIERRVTATLGDALSKRSHVAVVSAPGPAEAIAAGSGRMVVSLQEITPDAGFERDEFALAQKDPPLSRRVLPLRFLLQVSARLRPADTPAGAAEARTRMLDDLSLAAHALAAATFRNGKGLGSAEADPGFEVLSFGLETGTVARELADGM